MARSSTAETPITQTQQKPGARPAPPFRADQVGSLLRPRKLLDARDRRSRGEITPQELRAIEDGAIRDVVKLQEALGFEGVSDGEQRRHYFHLDFLEQIGGIKVTHGVGVGHFKRDDGSDVKFAPPKLEVVGKLRRERPIVLDDYRFLASVTHATPKITIPSPSMAHFRGGREAIDETAYPTVDEFFADLAAVYREEIADLVEAGCRYIQLDDTNLAYLCDPELRAGAKARGENPDELPYTYARLVNDSIATRSADTVVGIHLCRGNFKSAWVAQGGYEPVAEVMFNETGVDAFFLEYDDARSGDFAPLRFVPRGKFVVLGLVSTKHPEIESKDELKRRIEEATRFIDLDQLCLSPQCGFASTCHGNAVTAEVQAAKLRLVVETAEEVWG